MIGGDLIDIMGMNLPELFCLPTIRCQVSSKTTSRIQSDRIGTDAEPIHRPVSIDDGFFAVIMLVPREIIIQVSQEGRNLHRSINTIVWMESSMHQYPLITLDHWRQGKYPFTVLSQVSTKRRKCRERIIPPPTHTRINPKQCIRLNIVRHREVLMIPNHAPCIGTIFGKFYHLTGFRSLIDEISTKIEMILRLEINLLYELHEFIIAPMHITDKNRSFLHTMIVVGIIIL